MTVDPMGAIQKSLNLYNQKLAAKNQVQADWVDAIKNDMGSSALDFYNNWFNGHEGQKFDPTQYRNDVVDAFTEGKIDKNGALQLGLLGDAIGANSVYNDGKAYDPGIQRGVKSDITTGRKPKPERAANLPTGQAGRQASGRKQPSGAMSAKDAEVYLKAHDTPQNRKYFQDTYGYLPK